MISTSIRLLSSGITLLSFLAPASWAAAGFGDVAQADLSANSQLTLLLARIEKENPTNIERDPSGGIVALNVFGRFADDANLALIGRLPLLQRLEIRGLANMSEPTQVGFACLKGLTNLASLRISCFLKLNQNVLREVSQLTTLRRLDLASADAPRSEYAALTNLASLTELRIAYAPGFGDTELTALTNLTHLQRLVLEFDAVSPSGTNVLRTLTELNELIVKFSHH